MKPSSMKTLILVRHAKSSWDYDVIDKKRPLKKRGFNDAKLVAHELSKFSIEIDMVYSSPANRAYTTCNIFSESLNVIPDDIKIVEDLYDFGGENVTRFIRTLKDHHETVMIFGHNQAFTSIANLYGDKYIDHVPTSGVVMIQFQCSSWEFVKYGQTKLLLFPRDLKH